jgi:hypothetical protein
MLIAPVRITWDPSSDSVEFVDVDNGVTLGLVWPRGFAARVVGGHLEILSPVGSVVGRDGDVLSNLGGTPGDVCDVDGVLYPPAG